MTAFPLLEGRSRIGVVRPKGCLKTDIKASDTTIHNISIKKIGLAMVFLIGYSQEQIDWLITRNLITGSC